MNTESINVNSLDLDKKSTLEILTIINQILKLLRIEIVGNGYCCSQI